jgi:hypothetical protein
MSSRRTAVLLSTTGAAALAAVSAIVSGGAAAQPAALAAASCSPVANIEAIVDDSGSMSFTDPNKLRVSALDLLIDTPGNEKITLGAAEFGGSFSSSEPSADTVFAPQLIGPNAAAMRAALKAKINADNGLTDYNAAFAQASADDPNAKARIFLTDGGHDAGAYNNGHRGGPPTYVIGFSGATSGADGQRLKQIADETGGKYFAQTDSSNLQAVMNEIGTTLTCQGPPKSFSDAFAKVSAGKAHAVTLGSKSRSAQLTLSWSSPQDAFTIANLHIVRKGKTVAVTARQRRLKVTKRHGATFLVVKLTGLVPGSLRFRVRPTHIGSGAPRVQLTTQVTQSRR